MDDVMIRTLHDQLVMQPTKAHAVDDLFVDDVTL